MEALKQGADALFILLGGIMVLAGHAGFAFLEPGAVRQKNQVNALSKFWWIFQCPPWAIS
ncbi:MAG: amtB 1 [Polaromonas sp.]|jgi:Amt family ammonium transporter|nr:amtB 1 [Polaromonas sp.]